MLFMWLGGVPLWLSVGYDEGDVCMCASSGYVDVCFMCGVCWVHLCLLLGVVAM